MKYLYFRNTFHLQGNLIIFVQGFSLPFSVEVGGTVQFKIKTESADYRIDIFRVGWYWGAGARQVATVLPSASLPQHQPDCAKDGETLLFDCGNWEVSPITLRSADQHKCMI